MNFEFHRLLIFIVTMRDDIFLEDKLNFLYFRLCLSLIIKKENKV